MATAQGDSGPPHNSVLFQSLRTNECEIRLLEVQTARVTLSSTVVCRLVNVPLTEDLEFIGLSALVGDPTVTEDIQIDHRRISVPLNIGQALRHVRGVFLPSATLPRSSCSPTGTQSHEKQLIQAPESPVKIGAVTSIPIKPAPRWLVNLMRGVRSILPDSRHQNRHARPEPLRLWTESLCINTQNPQELSQRRETIFKVYSSAKMVVGWLGLKDDSSEMVIETMHTIDAAMPPRFGSPEDRELHPEHYAPHHVWMKDMMHLWALPPGTQSLEEWPIYVAMHAFMSRPFFQREWILNEIALARYPAFLLGDTILSWRHVVRMNRATEELADHGASVFPEEFRKALNFFPLTTVYTLLIELEKRQPAQGDRDDISTSTANS
ncbi:hypothetical protein VPNG_01325 [Cytospora leucostoma]|uniref:Heterokaryon incompatibility domain-containing protein n=1 Tax=Cytospora leucostoma TaxID=1230097 RepID=A0A423XMS6_9PEZI|nr:hypothetical protein VPNG_01325 [Cytospora leucostoma]